MTLQDKQNKIDNDRMQERLEDIEGLAHAAQIMENERNELLDKDRKAKNLFKNAWNEQMKMRGLHNKIDTSFKS